MTGGSVKDEASFHTFKESVYPVKKINIYKLSQLPPTVSTVHIMNADEKTC